MSSWQNVKRAKFLAEIFFQVGSMPSRQNA
jgi:hypothetical protein